MSTTNLLDLPIEVLLSILKYLDLRDVPSVMCTCRSLHEIIMKNNILWLSFGRRILFVHNSADNKKPQSPSYYHLCRISQNWVQGCYKKSVIVHHGTKYMPWIKYYNSEVLLLAIGSELICYGKTKRGAPNGRNILWSLRVPIVTRYDIRTNDITRFIVKDSYFICGNRDGCVSVFTYHDIKTKPRLLYHIKDCHMEGSYEVNAVEMYTNSNLPFVISASNKDPNLSFWTWNADIEEDHVRLSHSIELNNDQLNLPTSCGVRCLSYNPNFNKVALGLNEKIEPVLLDCETGRLLTCSRLSSVPKQPTRDIVWHDPNTITLVTHYGLLQCIDIRSGIRILDTMDPFLSSFYCVKTDGQRAVVAGTSEYSRCVLFDIRKSTQHVQMYFTPRCTSPVYSLDFDSTHLLAAADRSIGCVDFNVSSSKVIHKDYSHSFTYTIS